MNELVHDLALESDGSVSCDVCVIGAGPVGLSVARELGERGREVVVLDRGNAQSLQPDAGQVAFLRREYRGATLGRAFALGGTSTLWGGQLLPVRPEDLEARPQIQAPSWPLEYQELEPALKSIESWLGVVNGGFVPPERLHGVDWQGFSPRWSKWIGFGKRNLYTAYAAAMERTERVRIYVNARAGSWQMAPRADLKRASTLTVQALNGKTLEVRAKSYVICAGALESARLVLELSEAAGGLSEGVTRHAGRGLHDHLSLRLGRLTITDRQAFQRLFAPFFMRDTMRSLRMELPSAFLKREGLPALYAHMVADADPNSGFAVLRDILRQVQHRRLGAALRESLRVPAALPGIADLVSQRYFAKRLALPRHAPLYLHCDFEQAPLYANRVSLGERNADGSRLLNIDWDLGENVLTTARAVQSVFSRFWQANGFERLGRLDMVDFAQAQAVAPTNLYDIYHPAGTTRMAQEAADGVIGPDLKVRGTDNVYVAGSAAFPSLGAANPTFTAMGLGVRLARALSRAAAA